MEPLISIIVPVYCVEKYLEKCIESILNQTYSNWELLLINDGSTDKSGSICDSYAKLHDRIKVFHQQNAGVSAARNEGIRQASGSYIMFVDGDDWIEEDTLESMMNQIKKTGADACFCNQYFRNNDVVMQATDYECENRGNACELVKKQLNYQFLASPCFGLIHRKKTASCLFDIEIHALEDWEYNFRMLTCLETVTVISKAFYHYRSVEGSASKSSLNDKKMSCFLIPDKVNQYIKEKKLDLLNEAKYVPVFLINHMLVILANTDYRPIEAVKISKIARKTVGFAIFSKAVKLSQKIYIIMAATSPKLFCIAYRFKYFIKSLLNHS